MNLQLLVTRLSIIAIFFGFEGGLPYVAIAFICGLVLPLIEVCLFKGAFYTSFPWEIYLALSYLTASLFYKFDEASVYMVLGYILSRLIIYFQVKPMSSEEQKGQKT